MRKLPLIIAVILSVTVLSCENGQKKPKVSTAPTNSDQLEILYFHGKQRCVTCLAIEKLTKEVLDADFAKEQKSGKVVFKIIDISLKENEAIAEKYEVAWSSLMLDKGGNVVNLTDMGFSYAKGQPEVFKSKLRQEITKLLK